MHDTNYHHSHTMIQARNKERAKKTYQELRHKAEENQEETLGGNK